MVKIASGTSIAKDFTTAFSAAFDARYAYAPPTVLWPIEPMREPMIITLASPLRRNLGTLAWRRRKLPTVFISNVLRNVCAVVKFNVSALATSEL